ncbi:tRNA pseudouridine synthase Pus10-like [Schistocerca gregaria]|uniref:tRNA pseudouridine synthase Pus10-like n=1 Tax=Schistocerca gregaria TaxID=7010 RepID=UPI00211EF7E1|nr:tRNA pseudouridine synthase Pus10-like [Schistocerca gregaria]
MASESVVDSFRPVEMSTDVVSTDSSKTRTLPDLGTIDIRQAGWVILDVFVSGRYCKYVRNLPQSPWIIDGVRKCESSVQELIGPILAAHFVADSYKFMASGREDVDVRMLGRGRPFIVELINTHRPHLSEKQYAAIQKEINQKSAGKIRILDLQQVSDKDTETLKHGEEFKEKSYQCVLWMPEPVERERLESLSQTPEFEIEQLTPIRVLHRRSLCSRKRKISKMSFTYINSHYALLDIKTQAGTYIKEFVHSDLGRTRPSLGDLLGQDVQILYLDVTEVELDFPKKLENEEEPVSNAGTILDSIDLNSVPSITCADGSKSPSFQPSPPPQNAHQCSPLLS